MKTTVFYLFLCLFGAFFACSSSTENNTDNSETEQSENKTALSDSTVMAITSEMMQAMGGKKAWDSTRYLAWNFFGARHLLWDKQKNRVRVDVPRDNMVMITTLGENPEGEVVKNGEPVTQPDSLDKYLTQARRIWANDSYWLFMPFKLQDEGVAVSYMGEDTTAQGNKADVLELKFDKVGFTPDNKYHVYVDKQKHLVTQWEYYKNAAQDTPSMTTPWDNYQQYGELMLSGGRGKRAITDIKVLESIPKNAFIATTSLELKR